MTEVLLCLSLIHNVIFVITILRIGSENKELRATIKYVNDVADRINNKMNNLKK